MKKLFKLSAIMIALAMPVALHAQEKKDDGAVKKTAKEVGNKTAEVASKGKAKITDQVHKDKVAPNGKKVYIDNHSKYYWVDDKGRRHYVTEAELKDKPKED